VIAARVHHPELLDETDHDPRELADNLDHIAHATLGLGSLRALDRALACAEPRATLLDVGTGNGLVARALGVRWGSRGIDAQLVGVDLKAQVGAVARATVGSTVSLLCGDALALPFGDGAFDFAMSVLTLHHFTDAGAARALTEMKRVARKRVVVVDLERSRIALLGAQLLAASVWRGNRLTRHDAPLSVRRSFTRAELSSLATAAGLERARVIRSFPMRLMLVADLEDT
jgi:ubiquinone/menaquinone biosynthesis C-methylase UbiE